jgi:hypothetical protein
MAVFNRTEYVATPHDKNASSRAHRRYYAQLVSPSVIARVVGAIGADTLRASTCEHFNDIPLALWDAIACTLGPLPVSFDSLGDFATPGGLVCVAKEAARQYLEGKA